MSMQCSVLCPDGHRVPIKMSRQTPLLTILEEACGKRKLDPAKHAIRRENDRPNVPNLDCSLTIGFAGQYRLFACISNPKVFCKSLKIINGLIQQKNHKWFSNSTNQKITSWQKVLTS